MAGARLELLKSHTLPGEEGCYVFDLSD
jgi:hypothetical protein